MWLLHPLFPHPLAGYRGSEDSQALGKEKPQNGESESPGISVFAYYVIEK